MRRPLLVLVGVIIALLIFTSPLTFLLPLPAIAGAIPNEPKDVETGDTVTDEIVSSQTLESQDGFALAFRALTISPSDRQMTGEVTAALNEAAKRTLRDYKNDSLVTCHSQYEPYRLSLSPTQPTPTLVVGVSTGITTFERSVSLIDLFRYNLPGPLIALDSVAIPLRGLPTYYPSDSYAVTLRLYVRSDDVKMPSILSYRFGSDRMSDMNSSIQPVSSFEARFAFTRLLLTQVFVYGIAYALPLVLLLAVVVLLYLRPTEGNRPSIETFWTIGLLAVTLLLVHPMLCRCQ